MLLRNPSFTNVTREVPDAEAEAWIAAGWRADDATPSPAGEPAPAPDSIEPDASGVTDNSESPAETQE